MPGRLVFSGYGPGKLTRAYLLGLEDRRDSQVTSLIFSHLIMVSIEELKKYFVKIVDLPEDEGDVPSPYFGTPSPYHGSRPIAVGPGPESPPARSPAARRMSRRAERPAGRG